MGRAEPRGLPGQGGAPTAQGAPFPVHAARPYSFVRRFICALLDWAEDPEEPASVEHVAGQMFTDPTSVRAFYEDTSYGKVTLTGNVFGWYTLASPKSPCSYDAWASAARARATAEGHDLSGYDHLIYAWPSTACPWAGFADQPGSTVYVDGVHSFGLDLRTVAHELGHNFGVGHANTLRCVDTSPAKG